MQAGIGVARVGFAEVGAEVAFGRGEAGVVPVDEAVCAVRAAQGLVGRGVAVVVARPSWVRLMRARRRSLCAGLMV